MSERGEVLVAIINNLLDFDIARNQHWYRIPVSSMEKRLKNCWPPQWLAFYQTKIFKEERYSIRYYTKVLSIERKYRWQLFPDEPLNSPKRNKRYHQLWLEPLQQLPQPIFSRRWRFITFIPTTWEKFVNAAEINELYDESPLEDLLWAQLKRLQIPAERQEFIRVGEENYSLDFAIYCAKSNLDVETDGDLYHANPEKAVEDNRRNNDLEAAGWKVLRFSTRQIREEMAAYCVPNIIKTINKLGGLDEGEFVTRKIPPDTPDSAYQPSLFDGL
jgi:very-short-patch-repair endonuclease